MTLVIADCITKSICLMQERLYLISPDSSNPFLTANTAINSLMIAAAAIVPCIMFTNSVEEANVEQIIPVNTKDTPE